MTLEEPAEGSPTLRLDEGKTILEAGMPRRKQVVAPPMETDRLWAPEEVARFLGVPVHTLYRWRYLGTGPKAGRVGRHLRYLPADVMAWFRKQQAA